MQLSFLIISRTGKIKLRPYLLHPSENLSFLLQQQCSFLPFLLEHRIYRSTNVASIKKYKKATKVLLIVGRKLLSHSYILFFHNISTNWLAPLPSFYPFLCKMHNAGSEKRSHYYPTSMMMILVFPWDLLEYIKNECESHFIYVKALKACQKWSEIWWSNRQRYLLQSWKKVKALERLSFLWWYSRRHKSYIVSNVPERRFLCLLPLRDS